MAGVKNPLRPRVPLLSINGFLGAGKTTLVNHLLAHANGRRIVVFVNDFGAINIDYSLVTAVEEDRISLSNGCVCCSLNDDLVKGIAELVKPEQRPEAIVIEASGVADPRALDASLGILEQAGMIRLDNKLYVLDAKNFDKSDYSDTEYIIDHAAISDMVLLNKVDLVEDVVLQGLRDTLQEAAPYARLIETIDCVVPAELLLEFRRSSGVGDRADISADGVRVPHLQRYQSWSVQTVQSLDRGRFIEFAKGLPQSCLRAKGLLRFSDAPDSMQYFNLVAYRASLESKPAPDSSQSSSLVAIGLAGKIDVAEMQRRFDKVCA